MTPPRPLPDPPSTPIRRALSEGCADFRPTCATSQKMKVRKMPQKTRFVIEFSLDLFNQLESRRQSKTQSLIVCIVVVVIARNNVGSAGHEV